MLQWGQLANFLIVFAIPKDRHMNYLNLTVRHTYTAKHGVGTNETRTRQGTQPPQQATPPHHDPSSPLPFKAVVFIGIYHEN